MAGKQVVEPNRHTDFFRSRIQLNIQYWQDFLRTIDDTHKLDQEFPRIVRAISFGLEQREIWADTYNLLVEASSLAEKRGFLEQWVAILNRANYVAGEVDDVTAEINITALLGRFTQLQSQFPYSIKHYRRMLKLSRQNADRYNEARAATNLGYIYIEQGRWWRAEVLCKSALGIFEQIQNNHGRAHTENHLGILYTRQHLWPQAKKYLESACDQWRAIKDEQGLLLGLINLGLLYNEMVLPKKALLYLTDSLTLANRQGNNTLLSVININLGIAYRYMNDLTQASLYSKLAESSCRRFSNLSGVALAWDNLGLTCIEQQEWTEAQHYLNNALSIWHQLQNQHNAIRTQLYFVEYELAQNHQLHAIERLDSLERLNHQNNWFDQYPVLHREFIRYRGSLGKQPLPQAAADGLLSELL